MASCYKQSIRLQYSSGLAKLHCGHRLEKPAAASNKVAFLLVPVHSLTAERDAPICNEPALENCQCQFWTMWCPVKKDPHDPVPDKQKMMMNGWITQLFLCLNISKRHRCLWLKLNKENVKRVTAQGHLGHMTRQHHVMSWRWESDACSSKLRLFWQSKNVKLSKGLKWYNI